jgi:hypothetical protein
VAAPAGRFSVAFDDPTWKWDVTWTALDQEHPNFVTSWSVDRGRAYELDRTDAAQATVQILDPDGILDPTNPHGPYYAEIAPLKQCVLCRWDPHAAEWQDRFRGWIGDLTYDFDPSQRVNRLTLQLVDIFEMLGAIEMTPASFGDPAPPFGDTATDSKYAGQVFFEDGPMDDRIRRVLGQALNPDNDDYWVVFSGNVVLQEWSYSGTGESPLTVVQEAADAEFPGVANVYTTRHGELAVHGRYARFDPSAVIGSPGGDRWDFHYWQAGDNQAVMGDVGAVAQLRQFGFNLGVSKIINHAIATPVNVADRDVPGQLVTDDDSIEVYGIRSWTSQNLLTKGFIGGDGTTTNTALQETKKFAQYYVTNYNLVRPRVTQIGFRSIDPNQPGGGITWQLMSRVDISDQIDVNVASPGGGGFTGPTDNAAQYYVDGIHETSSPLNKDYDNDTVTLDLTPRALYTSFPDHPPS